MADIIELIISDHRRVLRLQTALDDAARYDHENGHGRTLASVWNRLAELIELHIQAKQEICYLVMFGASPPGLAQMQEAIADHDDIREALGDARLHPVGSDRWWAAVKAALSTWAGQTDREEQGVLAGFARRAGRAQRDDLGRRWSAFIAARLGDLIPQARPGDAVCQMCQWPVPASHRHVIDADHAAILCSCPACYELSHQGRDGQNPAQAPSWPDPSFSQAPASPR